MTERPDKPESSSAAPPLSRLAWVPVVAMLAVSVWLQLQGGAARLRAAGDPDGPPGADYAARFAGIEPQLPLRGPLVEVFPGIEIALVGYSTYAEAFTPMQAAMADPVVRRRVDQSSLHYNMTQQMLAPRIVVLPALGALYDRVVLVVGNYQRGADVPDASAAGFEVVADPGNGIVLWKRP